MIFKHKLAIHVRPNLELDAIIVTSSSVYLVKMNISMRIVDVLDVQIYLQIAILVILVSYVIHVTQTLIFFSIFVGKSEILVFTVN